MSDENQIAVRRDAALSSQDEWSVSDLMSQVRKVQEVMRAVMHEGEHYGVVPGTTGKKSLFKAGAEKLCMVFRLAPEYEVTRRQHPSGHVEYEVVCKLRHIGSGAYVGSGVGLCSSMEAKYRWRKGAHACPECGASAIIKGRAEYGGGWVCFGKKGGCGAKFPDDQFGAPPDREENPDISDTFNTILKMAKKRAHVDATITCTAASDIFTQDIEDDEVEPKGESKRATAHEDDSTRFFTEVRNRKWDRAKAAKVFNDCGQDADKAIAAMSNGKA